MNRNPNEKKLDVARDYWELLILKLKRRVSIYYRLLVVFSLLFYVVCFGSGAIISKPNDLKQTPLNEARTTETMSFKLVNQAYNQSQGTMEIDFVGEEQLSTLLESKEIQFEVLGKGFNSKDLTVTVKEGERNYYAVFIENLPKQWEGLMVTVGEKGHETSVAKFVLVYSKIDKNSSVSIKSEDDVRYESVGYQIELRAAEDNAQQKKITSNNQTIATLKEEIKVLEEDKVYQTEEELKATDGRIKQIETSIDSYQSNSLQLKKRQDELRKQIEKLKEKQGHVYRKDLK